MKTVADLRSPATSTSDDLGDQITGLNPTDLLARNAECALNCRQRGGDDLNVEDSHEHADAHHGESDPRGQFDLGFDRRLQGVAPQRAIVLYGRGRSPGPARI